MNIHVHESIKPPLSSAIEQVQTTLAGAQKVSMEQSEGGVVVLGSDPLVLERIHDFRRVFVPLLMRKEQSFAYANAPHNVRPMGMVADLSSRAIPAPMATVGLLQLLAGKNDIALQSDSDAQPASDAKRILVVDDTLNHIQAAIDQLGDQDLRLATTYAQAVRQIEENTPEVVLTDLNMPPSVQTLGEDAIRQYAGTQQPMGNAIAWHALQSGVQRVGILTDANHHSSPHSAAIDRLSPMNIGEARIVQSNNMMASDGAKDWRSLMRKLLED